MAAQPPAHPQIRLWVRERLENTVGRVRLEHSMYGPILNVLREIFPLGRRFMVKPQAPLRDEYDADISSDDSNDGSADEGEDDENVADYSFDSNFGYVRARSQGRIPKGEIGYADFTVVKATVEIDDDTIVAVIEVKVDDSDSAAVAQLLRYLIWTASKQHAPHLLGFLILGGQVRVWELHGSEAEPETTEILTMPTTSDDFYNALHDIAVQNWA